MQQLLDELPAAAHLDHRIGLSHVPGDLSRHIDGDSGGVLPDFRLGWDWPVSDHLFPVTVDDVSRFRRRTGGSEDVIGLVT
jgi:hypothetical protein